MSEYVKAGRYVKTNDPDQFQNICSIIQNKTLTKVGQYLEMVDPETFEMALEGES
jgi:hypothetical protein